MTPLAHAVRLAQTEGVRMLLALGGNRAAAVGDVSHVMDGVDAFMLQTGCCMSIGFARVRSLDRSTAATCLC